MQMTDLSFLLYFLPVLLLGHFALSFSHRAQNFWLAAGSLVFYAFGSIPYTALLLVLAMANYYLGWLAQRRRAAAGKTDKAVVALAAALNLLPLFFFKYLPPMAEGLAELLNAEAPAFPAVPFGISFLALQGISYVVDIARGKAEWSPRFTSALLYLAFFPPLAAGPLVRYQDVARQIEKKRKLRFDKLAEGLGRLVVGLGKVVLLGGTLLKIADIAFEQSNNSGVYVTVPVSLALLGLGAFALGLYHALSGFSDIVIGLGMALGFHIPENFDHPVLASSVTSFWRRCYSSLTAWFEEYVYGPLNKGLANNDRMVYHLLVMWGLIGLWTGPGWSRIIFGLLSFLAILVERIIELDKKGGKNPLRHLYVVFVVLLSLVALRSDTIYQFTLFIANLFGMRGGGFYSPLAADLLRESWPTLALALVCSFPIGIRLRRLTEERGRGRAAWVLYPVAMGALAVLVLVALAHTGYDPNQIVRLQLWR